MIKSIAQINIHCKKIVMENPGLRLKKNLTTNRNRILMFSDRGYAYDLSLDFVENRLIICI